VRKGGGRINPPLPFDTTKALQQSDRLIEKGRSRGQGDAPPGDPPGKAKVPPASPPDTFSHQRHRRLACLTCHSTTSRRSKLTFEAPRGCQICHHQGPSRSDCATCHAEDEVSPARSVRVQVAVPQHEPRSHDVSFEHSKHTEVQCVQCHTTPVSLDPEPKVKTCLACHEDHHTAQRDCATCHQTAEIKPAHAPPITAHEGCDACHRSTTVQALTPDRGFCLTCHNAGDDHYAPRQCTECHFQDSPDEYRSHLLKAGAKG
jgi:hypothetical protein